ncbi:DUF2577 family protein [Pseudobacillus sp. FSL P4-0506]|uniref:DUF2577 family protein n=1 Tax=Pseudobacillus sp. FSL P4-0506 TaxID=2921576 RepID=UPI0030F4BF34
MRHVPREKSDPFTDFAKLMKDQGYNKDVKLATGTVTGISPVKVKLDGNGLETTSLIVPDHLQSAYYPAHIIFQDTMEHREVSIMIDNSLEIDDRVQVIYDDSGNKLTGFILSKEG